jgi:hypothetical protein
MLTLLTHVCDQSDNFCFLNYFSSYTENRNFSLEEVIVDSMSLNKAITPESIHHHMHDIVIELYHMI